MQYFWNKHLKEFITTVWNSYVTAQIEHRKPGYIFRQNLRCGSVLLVIPGFLEHADMRDVEF